MERVESLLLKKPYVLPFNPTRTFQPNCSAYSMVFNKRCTDAGSAERMLAPSMTTPLQDLENGVIPGFMGLLSDLSFLFAIDSRPNHGNKVVPLPFGGQNSTVLYGPGNNLAPFESVSLGGVVE